MLRLAGLVVLSVLIFALVPQPAAAQSWNCNSLGSYTRCYGLDGAYNSCSSLLSGYTTCLGSSGLSTYTPSVALTSRYEYATPRYTSRYYDSGYLSHYTPTWTWPSTSYRRSSYCWSWAWC
jgi:hypothetical protein